MISITYLFNYQSLSVCANRNISATATGKGWDGAQMKVHVVSTWVNILTRRSNKLKIVAGLIWAFFQERGVHLFFLLAFMLHMIKAIVHSIITMIRHEEPTINKQRKHLQIQEKGMVLGKEWHLKNCSLQWDLLLVTHPIKKLFYITCKFERIMWKVVQQLLPQA